MLKVLLDGALVDGQPFTIIGHPSELTTIKENSGYDDDRLTVDPDDLAAYQDEQDRKAMRRNIQNQVGDEASLLGTTADATAMLWDRYTRLLVDLSVVGSFAELKGVVADHLADLATWRDGIDDGTIKLPHMVKGGEAGVLREMGERCTKVAEIFEAQQVTSK